MLPEERYQIIIDYLKTHRMVRIQQMADRFGISVETVRRDLAYLQKEGIIRKVYGGATMAHPINQEQTNRQRMDTNTFEKKAIARRCAELIHEGDKVFIGPGTTTLQVAKELKDSRKELSVLTSSIQVASVLIHTNFEVYILGGQIRKDEGAISGSLSLQTLQNFHGGTAIIGTGGVTVRGGLTDYNLDEVILRRSALKMVDRSILVADHTKFGRELNMQVCPLIDISVVISDRKLRATYVDEMKNAGIEYYLA